MSGTLLFGEAFALKGYTLRWRRIVFQQTFNHPTSARSAHVSEHVMTNKYHPFSECLESSARVAPVMFMVSCVCGDVC